MAHLNVRFHILLGDDDVKRLRAVARVRQCSQAQVMRHAITAAFLMSVRGIPSCADGSRCSVSHIARPDLQPLDSKLLDPDIPNNPTNNAS